MPLVRIDLIRGRSAEEVRGLADTVQSVLEEVFAAPAHDRYQLITEHDAGQVIVEDSGLGIPRSDRVVVIEVTHQGRDRAQKQLLYETLAERLDASGFVAPTDLVVSLVENTKEDWSFGHGRAQFLTGEL
ncbi:MAG: tautomerase family protein [Acidobacteria bacterium]|nr:tautomerase family protein [Acidobacteriota bacterium]